VIEILKRIFCKAGIFYFAEVMLTEVLILISKNIQNAVVVVVVIFNFCVQNWFSYSLHGRFHLLLPFCLY